VLRLILKKLQSLLLGKKVAPVPEVSKDDTHLKVSSDVKTALSNGRKKQIVEFEDGKPVVKKLILIKKMLN
jgi:hypothetical protein